MATHSNVLAWKIPWTEGPGAAVHGQRGLGAAVHGQRGLGAAVHGQESDVTERLTLSRPRRPPTPPWSVASSPLLSDPSESVSFLPQHFPLYRKTRECDSAVFGVWLLSLLICI